MVTDLKSMWIAGYLGLLLLTGGVAHSAQTYYVDATNGDDANPGTSEAVPWQTVAKVSEQTFQPGDTVLLKRGETWAGHLEVGEDSHGDASRPITFGAYGNGEKPVIRRLTARGDYAIEAQRIAYCVI